MSMMLIGLIPLVAFVIADSFLTLKQSLLVAIVFGVASALFSYFYLGHLDTVTVVEIGLILAFAGTAYLMKSEQLFLFQPVVLSVLFGIALITAYFMKYYVVYEMMLKYRTILPEQVQYNLEMPIFQDLLKGSTITLGVGFLFHAAATAYAAMKLNKWWWIFMRGIAIYGFIFLSMVAARIFFT